MRAYRADGRHDIGIVVNIEPKHAASDAPADIAAARRADAYMNRQFLDPIFLRRYPDLLGVLPQKDIGSYIGVTPVGISRIAARVREEARRGS